MEKTIYVNRPASRTWNRLGVNEAAVRWDTDAETLLSNERFTAVSGENAPLRIEAADGGAAYGRRVYTVTAEAGAELTVFEVCTAAQPLAAELRLTAAEGAHLRVVQLLNPTRGAVLRHELSAQLAEHAKLDLISLQLGDGAVYADHQISLAGDGAALRVDLGYLARRSDTADIDLTVEQLGKSTVSEIHASGALMERAKKVFRGTIDFKRGSAGSVGSENEIVLLLGEDAENKTVPVILCAEENVEGSHGATIGELDADTLFYFASRGIDRAAAEADEHAGRAGAHQVQGSGVVGCAADDDRHVKVVDELLEVQRFLAGGDVLGGDHSAADHEQVHARVHHGGVELLGALRGERAGHGDTGGANLVQTLRDELRLDRLGIDLLDTLGGLIGRQSGDFVQQRGRILVTGPQTFQIEHAERTHLAHGDGGGRAGHRIHGGADHRHIELIGVDLPRGGDVLGVAGATGGDDCHIVECVAETAFFAQTDFNFLRHGFQPIARVGRQQGRFPRTGRLLQVVTNMRYD